MTNFENDPTLSNILYGNTLGLSTGNPLMDMMLAMLMPTGARGVSDTNITAFDANMMQRRARMASILQTQALSFNQVLNRGGFNLTNPGIGEQILASMLGGTVANISAPFIGGNPGQALMETFTRMNPMAMMNLGQIGSPIGQNQSLRALDRLMQNVYSGPGGSFNYGTMGSFNIEQANSALISSIQTGLFGHSGGNRMSMPQAVDTFMQGGGMGAFKAARGLFGNNMSSAQLADIMNNLAGTDTMNLANSLDAQKMESTLSSFKAMARTAGVAVESVLGIVEEAKALVERHPELKHVSGLDLMGFGTAGLASAQAVAQTYGVNNLRNRGGVTEVTKRVMTGMITQENFSGSKQLSGIYLMASQKGDTATMREIERMISSQNVSEISVANFANKISSSYGYGSAAMLLQAAESTSVQGLVSNNQQASQIRSNAGAELSASYLDQLDTTFAGVGKYQAMKAKIQENLANGMAFQEAVSNAGIALGAGGSMMADEILKQSANVDTTAIERRYNATARKNFEAASARAKQYVADEKKFNEMNAPLQQALGMNLFQGFISGQLSEKGLAGLLKSLTPEGTSSDIVKRVSNVFGGISGKSESELYSMLGGPALSSAYGEGGTVESRGSALAGSAATMTEQMSMLYGGMSESAKKALLDKNEAALVTWISKHGASEKSLNRFFRTRMAQEAVTATRMEQLRGGEFSNLYGGLQDSVKNLTKKQLASLSLKEGASVEDVYAAISFGANKDALDAKTIEAFEQYGKLLNSGIDVENQIAEGGETAAMAGTLEEILSKLGGLDLLGEVSSAIDNLTNALLGNPESKKPPITGN